MRKHLSTIILLLFFLAGLSLLLYPSFSDYWNSFHQSRAIASYVDQVAELDQRSYEHVWDSASAYNATLSKKGDGRFDLTKDELRQYNELLNVSGNGIMGYIEIPVIKCNLPIYHGTEETVLQVAIGHLAGSSLPVGGAGTHTILSGHRGLPSAKLFSDLDQLMVGDTFVMRILDESLMYQIDQIRIVLPYELEELEIVEGEDYCTLVTCTPYGLNTHRLLVRGHRILQQELTSTVRVTADALQIEPTVIAPIVAIPILLLLLGFLLVNTGRKKTEVI